MIWSNRGDGPNAQVSPSLAQNYPRCFFRASPSDALCAFCGSEADGGLHCLCKSCAAKLPEKPAHIAPIEGIDSIAAAFCYEAPITTLIHRFKYKNGRYCARFAAFAMADELKNLPLNAQTAFVAVPLHPRRMRERTFNQSEELCIELCALTGREWLPKALIRNRNTPHQTGLHAAERKTNLLGAFTATPMVSNRSIVLVDDVSTTGSTLCECAKALKEAGALQVYALVLAAG